MLRDAEIGGTAMDHVLERRCLINHTGLSHTGQNDAGLERAIVGGAVTSRQCRKLLIAGQKPL